MLEISCLRDYSQTLGTWEGSCASDAAKGVTVMTSYLKLICGTVVALLLVCAIVVQPTAADDWDDFSSAVRSAKRRYDKSLESAERTRDDAIEEAEKACKVGRTSAGRDLLDVFDEEILAAREDDDDETADMLSDARKDLNDVLLPKNETERDTRDIIEGTWTGNYADWTFKRSGTVTSVDRDDPDETGKGRWKETEDGIYIVWDSKMWARQNYWSCIRLPLNEEGSVVDEWSGIDAFEIKKKVRRSRRSEENGDEETEDETESDLPVLETIDLDWDATPKNVRDAKTDYELAIAELDETCEKAADKAQKTYLEAVVEAYEKLEPTLDKAIETAERKDDIELANKLDDAKFVLEKKSQGKEATVDWEQEVLGTWTEVRETARGDGYDGRWRFVFTKDGTSRKVRCSIEEMRYSYSGKWKVTDTHIIITWYSSRYTGGWYRTRYKRGSHNAWMAFRLPLDGDEATVDSWSGMDAFTFKKTNSDD